jgi:hypothetical protein
VFDDHFSPGQLAAEGAGGDGIYDAKFGSFDAVRRDLVVGQVGGKFGQGWV